VQGFLEATCDPNPAAALRPPLLASRLGSFAPEGSKQLAAEHPPHFPVRFHSSSPDSNFLLVFGDRSEMVVPLLTTKIVKKRTKHFKRAHSDRYIGLKVTTSSANLRCGGDSRRCMFCLLHTDDLTLFYIVIVTHGCSFEVFCRSWLFR
jgi:hypothetical protein